MRVIARRWTARATTDGADRYQAHFSDVVLPKLEALDGFRGALVLRDDAAGDRVTLTDITFWDSHAAIGAFSGPDASVAIVDDTARSLLIDYDTTTTHATVAIDARAA
jgi:heme-degrading monooxygenase HmoA